MKPTRSRALSAAVVLASVGASVLASPLGTAYAVARPHTRDDLVAHAAGPAAARPFPVSGLTVGPAPAIPYAFASKPDFGGGDWQLRRPDGTTLPLPNLTWSAWAPMGDGAIGMAGTEAGPELQRVSATGTVHTRMVEHFGLAVSPDHEILGWLGDHGTTHIVEGGGTRHFTMPRIPLGSDGNERSAVAALSGATTCQEQEPEGGGCTVFVNGRRHVWITSSHGIVDEIGPMVAVSDVNQSGRLAGLVSRRTSGHRACWGVYRAGGHRVFRTCDYYLDSFSPDGHRVLAERARVLWNSVRQLAMVDRDGLAVQAWSFHATARRSLTQLTWEDSHHLLGVLRAHGQWGLVRIGDDGSVEYAGPPVAEVNEFSPYDLPRR
jgi:hypothetical protein